MEWIIRNEREEDYRAAEEVTREAFWNLYVPGGDEHYLLHILRQSPDFIPELDFVAESGGRVVGNIVFSHSRVVDGAGREHPTITFGPVGVLPAFQGRGIGGALIRHGLSRAAEMGFGAVLIYGYPDYYQRFGFRSAREFGISNPQGKYPVAHQALELTPGALEGVSGKAAESSAFAVDPQKAADFDRGFPPKEKRITPSQKRFAETSGTYLE